MFKYWKILRNNYINNISTNIFNNIKHNFFDNINYNQNYKYIIQNHQLRVEYYLSNTNNIFDTYKYMINEKFKIDFENKKYLSFDHIIPLSLGGNHNIQNIQIISLNQNITKSNNINYYELYKIKDEIFNNENIITNYVNNIYKNEYLEFINKLDLINKKMYDYNFLQFKILIQNKFYYHKFINFNINYLQKNIFNYYSDNDFKIFYNHYIYYINNKNNFQKNKKIIF